MMCIVPRSSPSFLPWLVWMVVSTTLPTSQSRIQHYRPFGNTPGEIIPSVIKEAGLAHEDMQFWQRFLVRDNSVSASVEPTPGPSAKPRTVSPSDVASDLPSSQPTNPSTSFPTTTPSAIPQAVPSAMPSSDPTDKPNVASPQPSTSFNLPPPAEAVIEPPSTGPFVVPKTMDPTFADPIPKPDPTLLSPTAGPAPSSPTPVQPSVSPSTQPFATSSTIPSIFPTVTKACKVNLDMTCTVDDDGSPCSSLTNDVVTRCVCQDCVTQMIFRYKATACSNSSSSSLLTCMDRVGDPLGTSAQIVITAEGRVLFNDVILHDQDIVVGDSGCIGNVLDVYASNPPTPAFANSTDTTQRGLQHVQMDTSCGIGSEMALLDSFGALDFVGYTCREGQAQNCFVNVTFQLGVANAGDMDMLVTNITLDSVGATSINIVDNIGVCDRVVAAGQDLQVFEPATLIRCGDSADKMTATIIGKTKGSEKTCTNTTPPVWKTRIPSSAPSFSDAFFSTPWSSPSSGKAGKGKSSPSGTKSSTQSGKGAKNSSQVSSGKSGSISKTKKGSQAKQTTESSKAGKAGSSTSNASTSGTKSSNALGKSGKASSTSSNGPNSETKTSTASGKAGTSASKSASGTVLATQTSMTSSGSTPSRQPGKASLTADSTPKSESEGKSSSTASAMTNETSKTTSHTDIILTSSSPGYSPTAGPAKPPYSLFVTGDCVVPSDLDQNSTVKTVVSCNDLGKHSSCPIRPIEVTMLYSGTTCHQNAGDKGVICVDRNLSTTAYTSARAWVVVADQKGFIYFQNTVRHGENVTFNDQGKQFGSKMFIYVYESEQGSLIQSVQYSSRCASDLEQTTSLGAMQLVGFVNEVKDDALFNATVEFQVQVTVPKDTSGGDVTLTSLFAHTNFAGLLDLSKQVMGITLSSGESFSARILSTVNVMERKNYLIFVDALGADVDGGVWSGQSFIEIPIGKVPTQA